MQTEDIRVLAKLEHVADFAEYTSPRPKEFVVLQRCRWDGEPFPTNAHPTVGQGWLDRSEKKIEVRQKKKIARCFELLPERQLLSETLVNVDFAGLSITRELIL